MAGRGRVHGCANNQYIKWSIHSSWLQVPNCQHLNASWLSSQKLKTSWFWIMLHACLSCVPSPQAGSSNVEYAPEVTILTTFSFFASVQETGSVSLNCWPSMRTASQFPFSASSCTSTTVPSLDCQSYQRVTQTNSYFASRTTIVARKPGLQPYLVCWETSRQHSMIPWSSSRIIYRFFTVQEMG